MNKHSLAGHQPYTVESAMQRRRTCFLGGDRFWPSRGLLTGSPAVIAPSSMDRRPCVLGLRGAGPRSAALGLRGAVLRLELLRDAAVFAGLKFGVGIARRSIVHAFGVGRS